MAPMDRAPDPEDTQRRCWTIKNADADAGTAQCWLFNGHTGDHQFVAAPELC